MILKFHFETNRSKSAETLNSMKLDEAAGYVINFISKNYIIDKNLTHLNVKFHSYDSKVYERQVKLLSKL